MGRRVVITGMAPLTSVGTGNEAYWSNLVQGKSGIDRIKRFDAEGLAAMIAGEVVDFDPGKYMDSKEARRMDRFQQFAVAASLLALDDAELEITPDIADMTGM